MEKAKKHAPDVEVEEDFGEGYFAQYQAALWDLFEKPQSSLAAKVVSIVSVSTVLISTVGMCFNTFEWMQIKGRITLIFTVTSSALAQILPQKAEIDIIISMCLDAQIKTKIELIA